METLREDYKHDQENGFYFYVETNDKGQGGIKWVEHNSLREINIDIIPKLSKIKHIDGMRLRNT